MEFGSFVRRQRARFTQGACLNIPSTIAVGNHANDPEITDLQACAQAWLLGRIPSVLDFDGADSTGKQDSSLAFANAFVAHPTGQLFVPPGTYRVDAGGIVPSSGASVIGAGLASTRINYAGSSAAITLDGCIGSTVSGLFVVTSDSSATVRGIHLKNTTSQSKWNFVTDCEVVQNNATGRIAGQVGILMEDNSASSLAQFWNTVRGNKLLNWETSMGAVQSGAGADGVNQSYWVNNMCAAFITGLSLGPRCGDHVVSGLLCTHSSASVFTDTALVIGDGAGNSANNICTGIVADLGANGRAFFVQAGSTNNYIVANNESSQADVDSGTNTTIFLTKNISGANQRVRIPTLQVIGISSFSGNVSTGAGVQLAKQRAAGATGVTITSGDNIVLHSGLTAAIVDTLPSAAAVFGLWVIVADSDGSASVANTITVNASAGQTIDGAASVSISTANGSVMLLSLGSTKWKTI